MFARLILWILRLFAWPWAVRSCERWPAAPREVPAATNAIAEAGDAPRAKGARMGDTATFLLSGYGRAAFPA